MKQKFKPSITAKRTFFYTLLLFFSAAIVLKPTLDNGFISDDILYLELASKVIYKHDFALLFKPSFIRYIHPLVVLLFMAGFKLFQLNIFVYRLLILFLHCLSVILFFLLSSAILRKQKISSHKEWAFLAAFFFMTAHPHNEALLYLGNIAEVTCTFFALLCFLLYFYFLETKRIPLMILSAFCFVLSLLSKESAMLLPFILFSFVFFFSADKNNSIINRLFLSFRAVRIFFFIMLVYALLYGISLYSFLPKPLMQDFTQNLFHFPKTLAVWFPLWLANFLPVAKDSFIYMREQHLMLYLRLAYSLQGALFICIVLYLLCFIANKYKKEPETASLYIFSFVWITAALFPSTAMMRGAFDDLKDNTYPSGYYYFSSAGFSLLAMLALRSLYGTFTRFGKYFKVLLLLPAGIIFINILFFHFKEIQYNDRGLVLRWVFSSVSSMTDNLRKPELVVLMDFPEEVLDVRDVQNLIFLVHGKPVVVSGVNMRFLERKLCGNEDAKKLFYLHYDEKSIAVDKTAAYRQYFSSCWGNF